VSATPAVIVVDYGRGNLFSVCQAVARVGGAPALTADPAAVRQAVGNENWHGS